MLSIGQFAKLVKVSTRTVRYYESIGLIASSPRGENNYRYYDQSLVQKFNKICDLQNLGFSLDEIKQILEIVGFDFTETFEKKLSEINHEIYSLQQRKERLEHLLSVSQKIDLKQAINDTERKQYMEAMKEEIVSLIKQKYGHRMDADKLRYLERESICYSTPQKQEFLQAIKKCVQFAKDKNLKLGPGRGASSSSMVLYALGFNDVDPTEHNLMPERIWSMLKPDFHIDVQFEGGQDFVDYCRSLSEKLSYGEINAFKMPLIDIINNVHKAIGHEIDYQNISDDSDLVLDHFKKGDLEKIFLFDLSEDALVMKYENLFPEYIGLGKITEYLKSQTVHNFFDLINITSLWRPSSKEIVERLERYRLAKISANKYRFLTPNLQKMLEPNYGLVIYQEDIVQIIAEYTKWPLEKCYAFRRDLFFKRFELKDELAEFKLAAPKEVVDLVLEETKWAFCKPHSISFARLTKQTAILKSLHKEIYYAEIERWEAQHGFKWDDIGIKIKGVSLLQS